MGFTGGNLDKTYSQEGWFTLVFVFMLFHRSFTQKKKSFDGSNHLWDTNTHKYICIQSISSVRMCFIFKRSTKRSRACSFWWCSKKQESIRVSQQFSGTAMLAFFFSTAKSFTATVECPIEMNMISRNMIVNMISRDFSNKYTVKSSCQSILIRKGSHWHYLGCRFYLCSRGRIAEAF